MPASFSKKCFCYYKEVTSLRKYLIVFIAFLSLFIFSAAQASELTVNEQREAKEHNDEWGFPHREGIVLVLSGGGTKGLSHIGVLEVLEREKIPIAAIVGTSMGSIIGGLYASGYTSQEMKNILSNANLMEIISDRSGSMMADVGYNSPPSSGTSILNIQMDEKKRPHGQRGVLKAKDLYTFLSELTARVTVTDFDNLPIPFAAIATNLENGDTVVLRDGNLASALRASLSIPGIFEPWETNGKLLIDGGLKANLPVLEAKKIFPGHPVVAVNLSQEDVTQPREKLRSLLEIAAQSFEILMVDQIRTNAAAADMVIAPDVHGFGILDSTGYDKIIERGVAAAEPFVEDLHKLVQKHETDYSSYAHVIPLQGRTPMVVEISFEGIPASMAEKLYDKYDDWIGKPLDMKKIADAVKLLSERPEFSSVEGRTKNYTKDAVEVIFSIQRQPKYEFEINGYAGNINPERWLSLSAQVRDIFMDGDVAALEYRLGNRWGAMSRYFTPLDKNDSQFGIVLAGREEGAEPGNASDFNFERYTGKIAWYKNFNERFRAGIGYAVERISGSDGSTESGPYIHLAFNTLDDPILPTKGTTFASEIWLPTGETAVTHTAFQTHLPIWQKWKFILGGGLKTGDGDSPAYAAILGNNEELYSLAQHPLIGDQAYWLHLGAARMMLKSWWGGVNVELFGNYGNVLREWDNTRDWWEAGLALSIPTNNFASKFIVVYDQGGNFTFGYSIGIPHWWDGPIP
jgi:NTE family protein